MLKEPHEYDFVAGEALLIDKPLEWTSFDAVKYIRSGIQRMVGLKNLKAGHAGTLDPMATGLLILCTGGMTKRLDQFQDLPKEYVFTMRLGSTTPSFDLETEPDATYPWQHIGEDALITCLASFTGSIEQVPPAFSAIRMGGKRAYQLARKDAAAVRMEPRMVQVHELRLLDFSLPDVRLQVTCSKGTYVRSLARDIGHSLGSGAHLTALRRTAIGEYRVGDARTPKDFLAWLQS